MSRWIAVFSFILFGFAGLNAQQQVGCIQFLEDAREAYSAGMVELVPELIRPCLEEGGLEGDEKQEAYKLLVVCYLFDYLPEEADTLMVQFMADYPEYRVNNDDAPEFSGLLREHLLAAGLNPDSLEPTNEADSTGMGAGQDQERIPYSHSFGFDLGLTGTLPLLLEPYSMGDVMLADGYYMPCPGFRGGLSVNFAMGRVVETSIGFIFDLARYRHMATPIPGSSYLYRESLMQLEIPLSLILKLNPETERTLYYLRVGVRGEYLLNAGGKGWRSFDSGSPDLIVEKTDVSANRRPYGVSVLAGAGLRIPMEKAFFQLEAGFSSSLQQSNVAGERYPDTDLTWVLYHVDSDFLLQQFHISGGIYFNIKPKQEEME